MKVMATRIQPMMINLQIISTRFYELLTEYVWEVKEIKNCTHMYTRNLKPAMDNTAPNFCIIEKYNIYHFVQYKLKKYSWNYQ